MYVPINLANPKNYCKIAKNKIYKSWILNIIIPKIKVTEAGKIKIETKE